MTKTNPIIREGLHAGIFVLALLPTLATAQEQDTAQRSPAPDSAFLRVVMPVGETVRINEQNLASPADSPASPYLEVPAGPSKIIVSDVIVDLEAAGGQHYSYLWGLGGTGTLVEDAIDEDGDQASLKVYNLSSVNGLSLWINGEETAIADIASLTAESVAVDRPSQINAEVKSGDTSVGVVDVIDVAPGEGVSIAIWGDADNLAMQAFVDVYD